MKYVATMGVAAALVALAGIAPGPSKAAATETIGTIQTKIDLAGRQRMLSQRIAKAACMVRMGADLDAQRAALYRSRRLFGDTLVGLEHGSRKMGLVAEDAQRIISKLEDVSEVWQPLSAAAKDAIVEGAVADAHMEVISASELNLLRISHSAVQRMDQIYGEYVSSTRALNFAGAQRMLSQKIAKEICYLAARIDTMTSRQNLEASLALFDERQRILSEGDASVRVETPTAEHVLDALEKVKEARARLQPLIEAVLDGDRTDAETLTRISVLADVLLVRADGVVKALAR